MKGKIKRKTYKSGAKDIKRYQKGKEVQIRKDFGLKKREW